MRVDQMLIDTAWEWASDPRAGGFAMSRLDIAKILGVSKSPTLVSAIENCVKQGLLTETDGMVRGRPGKVYTVNPAAVAALLEQANHATTEPF